MLPLVATLYSGLYGLRFVNAITVDSRYPPRTLSSEYHERRPGSVAFNITVVLQPGLPQPYLRENESLRKAKQRLSFAGSERL